MLKPHGMPLEAHAFAAALMPGVWTLGDIALALSQSGRYAGNTYPAAFSTAQHSVIVAEHVERITRDPLAALCALLHDGHEWRIGDVLTVVSFYVARYVASVSIGHESDPIAELKTALDALIFPALGLPWPLPPAILAAIKQADEIAFMTELRDVALPLAYPHSVKAGPSPKPIPRCWPAALAEERFLKCWDRLALLAGLPSAKRRAA